MKSVRIWFRKENTAKYLSHLDSVRSLSRAFNRVNFPIWYTQGFNPHPFMTFALPLPLGIEGLNEAVDTKITEDINREEYINKLNSTLPNGITISDMTLPIFKPKDINYALYDIEITSEKHNKDYIENKIKELFNMNEIIIEKKTKSGVNFLNIKENLHNIDIKNIADYIKLSIILPAGNTFNINPFLIIDSINKYTNLEICARIKRLNLYNQNFEIFK